MKVYTKKGDKGQTGLYDGSRVKKNNPRIEFVGEMDELIVRLSSVINTKFGDKLITNLIRNCFYINSLIATPDLEKAKGIRKPEILYVCDEGVILLEQIIDEITKKLPKLTKFTIPIGNRETLALEMSRVQTRKVERRLLDLTQDETISDETHIMKFINRLSDLLFTLARFSRMRDEIIEIEI